MDIAELASRPRSGADYQSVRFDARRWPDQNAATPARHPVVIVGAGPVGLSLAIDLAQRQVPVVVLEGDNVLSVGSRALCFAKRTLEIFDRLGVGQRMIDKGVSWQVGRVFFGDDEVYHFDLHPEPAHQRPAFINLQQYYVEGFLAERLAQLAAVQLRWSHRVTGVQQHDDHAVVTIQAPDGEYRLRADWLVACDGSRSAVRSLIGQESRGRVFRDRFLIADVRMPMDRPAERWFWFDPPFHRNQSVLLHRQPDGVWRIDFQLGWDADPEVEKRPENIRPRIEALLGAGVPYELEWASVYTFACLRMERFRHGRVLFAGDSAHGVSPFGARGANSGIQDADNLAWKLQAVLARRAPDTLLDTYADEREHAADENLLNSTRSTDFITPKSDISRLFRDATLDLARRHPFARRMVNSGRLSVPAVLSGSVLNTPDTDAFDGRMVPGAPALDAPVVRADGTRDWLLRQLDGEFTALVADADPALAGMLRAAADGVAPLRIVHVRPPAEAADGAALHTEPDRGTTTVCDVDGLVAQRFDLRPGTVVLLRPDQHVCARWRRPDEAAIRAALRRALGQPTPPVTASPVTAPPASVSAPATASAATPAATARTAPESPR